MRWQATQSRPESISAAIRARSCRACAALMSHIICHPCGDTTSGARLAGQQYRIATGLHGRGQNGYSYLHNTAVLDICSSQQERVFVLA